MRIRSIGAIGLLCALLFVPLNATRVSAQSQSAEKPALYTYVSEWTVPRAMWADYLKTDAADADIMKKAVADGSLTSFGSYAVINHQEGLPTHGTWFSATSMGNLLKVLETVRNAPGATAPPLAAAKHWDYILESKHYNHTSGTFTNGYIRISRWAAKPGSADAEGKIIMATFGSMLDKLVADGSIHGYQIDQEAIHSADPGMIFLAVMTNGPEGIDKFYAALEASEKENPSGWAGLRGEISEEGHRDTLARVSSSTHK
jgi:hypothetical protein